LKARASSTNNQLRPVGKTVDSVAPSKIRNTSKRITSVENFDPLKNVHPLPLSVAIDLSAVSARISDSTLIDLFTDFWPPAPSSFRDRSWDIKVQMRAAGFSTELVKNHCLKAAFSWGV
jgi:hypothetical protein